MPKTLTLPPFAFDGAYAVLTGAASGMGEMMAHQLADRGTHLVLVDRDEPRLAGVADLIRATHPALTVHTEVTDLADPAAVVQITAALTLLDVAQGGDLT